MDYLDKLFSQHVFIYKISGKYYAFGIRVCAECKMNIPALELRYNRYDLEMKELKNQVEKYAEFWKKYKLYEFSQA